MAMTARCFANRVPRPARAFQAPTHVVAGDHGAGQPCGPAIAMDTSEEHAGKPYRSAAILADARGPALPVPDSRLHVWARPDVPSLAYGLQDVRVHRLRESPHAPSGAQAATTRRRALARAGRARTGGRTRSSRSAITSGAAQTMTLRWYAQCSFNDAAPPGGASKCREEP
jgi:hypothetical protein